MSDNKEVSEAEEWYRQHFESMMDALSKTFEREARISGELCTISEDRKRGRIEAYEACALAVTKASTRRMFILPEPWIGYVAPTEATS